MVRTLLLGAAALSLAACDTDRYTKPIAVKPHGDSVRANMAAQIINPVPPAPHPTVTGASRPVLAIDAYRKNEIEEPSREDAAASSAKVNN